MYAEPFYGESSFVMCRKDALSAMRGICRAASPAGVAEKCRGVHVTPWGIRVTGAHAPSGNGFRVLPSSGGSRENVSRERARSVRE